MIYYAILICREFDLKLSGEIIIISFLLFNPTIIFYENLFDYNQVITFLFTQMSYFIIKFFKSNENKFEILTYVNLLLLSYFWALFQPALILLDLCSSGILIVNILKFFVIFDPLIFFDSIN